MSRTTWAILAIALAVVAAGCGGDDGGDNEAADGAPEVGDDQPEATTDASTGEASSTSPAADDQGAGADEPTTETGGSPVPIARFTAHGPQAANTIGPPCSVGVDDRGGGVFRFTPPEPFVWSGMSGGTGPDQVEVRADDVSLFVTESAYDYDTAALREWQVVGPAGVDVEIDGVTIPVAEITLEGDAGYALVDVDYLSPMPTLTAGAALGTVAVTSPEADRPTLEEATELLASVRVERCAAVAEALIWGPADGTHLVPRFEPDPLGKAYPEEPQPAYEPGVSPLDAYSIEQLAYLMPVENDIAVCAAEKAREFGVGNPIAHLSMLTPSGTGHADLEAVVAEC